MQRISGFLLAAMGWNITNQIPSDVKKAIIIMAPHTSYFDFVMGKFGYWYLGIPSRFYIKKEAFFWPLGPLLNQLGGIPVDRKRKSHVLEMTTRYFKENESFYLTITPEGTRALVRQWKKGFYILAMKTGVPIVLGYLDYQKKTGGPTKVFYPTGDYEADMKKIEAFYRGINGRHPERFNVK